MSSLTLNYTPDRKTELTEQDRAYLWNLLRESGSKAMPKEMKVFVDGIQFSLDAYHKRALEDPRRRSAREDLRELFMACRNEKNISKIRRRFLRLPLLAREELIRRAKLRDLSLNFKLDQTWQGLCAWVQTSTDEDLLTKLPSIITGGRVWSYGQKRKNGVNSAPHVEPMIMGEFLRLKPIGEPMVVSKSAHKGGHPADAATNDLIAELALLWIEVTGKEPPQARSNKNPFAKLVYYVLGMAGVSSPQNAFRRYWDAVKRHRLRPSNISAF